MSISILNRGASGGLKPELTVTAPSGSTIDLLQNGIIVATYTLGAEETSHTFVVKVGTYTVRGTLDTATAETEVVIDAVGQYAVKIQFTLWLYRTGDEYVDTTGGWSASSTPSYNSSNATPVTPSLTKNSDCMYVVVPYASGVWNCGSVRPNNLIDVTSFDTLKMRYACKTHHSSYRVEVYLACLNDGATYIQDALASQYKIYQGTSWSETTFEVDISEITGDKMIAVHINEVDYSMTGYVNIYEVWLE